MIPAVILTLPGCFLFAPGSRDSDSNKTPPPAGAPVHCWVVPDAAEVDPDGPEPTDNAIWQARQKAIILSAAPGEVIGFQIVAAPQADTRPGVAVRFAPLVQFSSGAGPAEGEIPASAYRAFAADWVRVRKFRPWYPTETGRPPSRRLFADPLTPITGTFTVPAGRPQPVFVDLDVPAGAPPGDYRGHIEIVAEGAAPTRLEVRLEVWPFELTAGRWALPTVARVNVGRMLAWEAGYAGAPAPPADDLMRSDDPAAAKCRESLSRTLALLREHGVRPMLDDVRPKVEFQWPGRATVEWAGYDAFMDAFAPLDPNRPREPLPAPISGTFPDPAAFEPVAGEPAIPGADKPPYVYYEQALRDYARQIARHLAERGRLGSAVVLYDPPAQSGPTIQLIRATRFAAVLGELHPNLPVAAPFSQRWVRRHAGDRPEQALNVFAAAVGVWRPTAAWYDPPGEPEPAGAAARTPVWLAPSEPPLWPAGRVESPRAGIVSWGWASRRYRPDALDIGAACPWHAPDAQRRKAWSTAAGEPPAADTLTAEADGDSAWLYPGGPRPSIRLKLVRRAVQDYRHLQLLERAVGPQRAAILARALVRFALADGIGRSATEGRYDGWSRNADDYEQVRREVGRTVAAWVRKGRPAPDLIASPESWEKFLARNDRTEIEIVSTRLTPITERPGAGGGPSGARLDVRLRLYNLGVRARDDLGWAALRGLPAGWQTVDRFDLPKLDPGGAAEVVLSALLAGSPPPERLGEVVLAWGRTAGDRFIPLRFRRQVCRSVLIPPAVDGRLDDWVNRADAAADGFASVHAYRSRDDVLAPAGSARKTTVQTVCDEQFLYFAFDCPLEAGESFTVHPGNSAGRYGAALWEEDAVELVLIPPAEAGSAKLHRITVKANGAVEAAVGPDGRLPIDPWAADIRAACGGDAQSRRFEVRVPWAALGGRPKPGAVWGVNYSRHSAAAGETSAWSPSNGHIFRSETAGMLVLR